MDVSYSVQLIVVVSVIVHSNSLIQEGFGQQFYIYSSPCLFIEIDMKTFTFPGMLLLGTGRLLASSLVLAQMPAISVDHQVRPNQLSALVHVLHLFPRASSRIEVRRGLL